MSTTVQETNQSKSGQDSIFCNGGCDTWLHRGCAGLSKAALKAASKSNDPFNCMKCKLFYQESEIASLKTTVNSLVTKLSSLEEKLTEVCDKQSQFQLSSYTLPSQSLCVSPSEFPPLPNPTNPIENLALPHNKSNLETPRNKSHVDSVDRKFNIVMFGIEECQVGTARYTRQSEDLEKVTAVISSVDASLSSTSVKDHFRLGKS